MKTKRSKLAANGFCLGMILLLLSVIVVCLCNGGPYDFTFWSYFALIGYYIYLVQRINKVSVKQTSLVKKRLIYVGLCVFPELVALWLWLSDKISKWLFFALVMVFSVALVIIMISLKEAKPESNEPI